MFYNNINIIIFKVLVNNHFMFFERYICLDYLYIHKEKFPNQDGSFNNTRFDGFLGLDVMMYWWTSWHVKAFQDKGTKLLYWHALSKLYHIEYLRALWPLKQIMHPWSLCSLITKERIYTINKNWNAAVTEEMYLNISIFTIYYWRLYHDWNISWLLFRNLPFFHLEGIEHTSLLYYF